MKQKSSYPSKNKLIEVLDTEAKKLLDEGEITPEQYKGLRGIIRIPPLRSY